MKKRLIGFLGAGVLVLLFGFCFGSAQAALNVGSLGDDVLLGVYDPNQAFPQEPLSFQVPSVGIEKVFIGWRRVGWHRNHERNEYVLIWREDAREFTSTVKKIRQRGRLPFVTIEPFPFEIYGLTKRTLFEDMTNGRYDKSIRLLAQAAAAQNPQVIMISWGHEMELTGLYPWCQEDPEGYISAYRHFVDIFRQEGVTNVWWVWAPAGNKSCQLYWPGAEYVDFIGVTTLISEEWETLFGFEEPRSFATFMRERYQSIQGYNKPIIAAEVGVSMSDPESESAWLIKAVESLAEFPEIIAWVYFNSNQSANLYTFGIAPDWELNEDQILVLMDAWNNQYQ